MQTILQVEFSPSLALIREEILTSLGYEVISVIGSVNAWNLDLVKRELNVIIIGHGSPWDEREQLIKYFGEALPGVPIVALLRMRDATFSKAAFNIRADNPQNWVRVINRFTSARLPRHIQVSESACS
jgi:hypothetical protein